VVYLRGKKLMAGRISAQPRPGGIGEEACPVFRAVFVPSPTQALGPSRGTKERQAFSAALEADLERRLVDYPMRIDHLVGMIVLAKQGAL
jgi:hypothetical protein